jgi:hypothetical protein
MFSASKGYNQQAAVVSNGAEGKQITGSSSGLLKSISNNFSGVNVMITIKDF